MIPLRLVVDTNIVVLAALKPESLPRTVILLAITKPARLYVTGTILEEYRAVLARPELRIRKGMQRPLLRLLMRRSHLVKPGRPLRVCGDPDDNTFIECVEAGRADYLVTGNARHFPAFWRCATIITPRQFIEMVAPHLLP